MTSQRPLRIVTMLFLLAITASSTIAQDKKETKRLSLENVQRFTTAISQIKNYYVKPVDDKKLFDEAIRGMLKGLDPHSTYLDEKEFSDLQENTRGEFSGLGIEVTMEDGVIKVISPIDGSPAAKAGIQPGDLIVKVGKKPIKGMTLREAVNIMRGKIGTKINILVLRKGSKKPLPFTITRNRIHIQSVKSKLLDKKYAYIRVSHFQEPSAKDLKKAVVNLRRKAGGNLSGLILDLRNNPGGLLDSAIDISDAFIHNDKKGKEEIIVYTKGRLPGSAFEAIANPGDVMQNAPIVVLINQGSASASEIVAGALQDHKRAVIMGTKSFGKGSVQTILPLGKKSGIKLTTALYYTPSGRSIQAEGVVPHIVVDNVTVPEDKKDKSLLSLSEADLQGHLANGNDGKSKKASDKDGANAKDTKKLIHTDYQLHEALTLLKGLSLRKR
jgi:carboxyl-terminal processing protease